MTGAATSAALAPTPMARAPAQLVLVLAILFAAIVAGPALYGVVAFHGAWRSMLEPIVLQHVAFNCAANLVVMLGSLNLTGRLDQRLSNVFRRTAIVHGALAFFTLISRHYYSIPMMLTAAPCSALGGAAVMLVRQRVAAPLAGVLGPPHWVLDDRGLRCRVLDAPDAAITPYDLILITFDGDLPPAWTPLLSRALLAGKPVRHVAAYLEEARGVVSARHFDLDHLPRAGLASYRTPKRLFDLLCVVAAAPAAIPVLLVAAASIRLSMGAPVLFVQQRVGLGGAAFRMFKLRTMSRGPGGSGPAATVARDRRITPLGRILRRFRIDELPQLWNVLIGDMSVVGPRPEQPALAQAYIREVPAFAFRTLVRPGITGWAQVRAGYAADLEETRVKLAYDLFYLKNFSFGLDVRILGRTVWTLISGAGVR